MSSRIADINFVVIQNNAADTALIQDLLKQSGAQTVRCFQDLKEAAQVLRSVTAGFIISDLDSTPVNGAAFATMLRSEKMTANHQTPLLLTATNKNSQGKEAALAAGASGIITKPLTQADLIKHLGICFKNVA